MKRIAVAALLIAAAVSACQSAGGADTAQTRIIPLPSFAAGRDEIRFGRLDYVGGIQIVSADRRIGGLSGIAFLPDGASVLLVSDNGYLITGRLQHEHDRLGGFAVADVRPIFPGAEREDPKFDVEDVALAADGRSGYLAREWSLEPIIAFTREGEQLTRRESVGLANGDPRLLDSNQSIESIAIAPASASGLPPGSVVVIAEHPGPGEDFIRGWIDFEKPIRIARHDGYDVSSAGFLPDGDLVILERRFGPAWGIGMRIRRIPASRLESGALLDGETLIEAGLGEQIDNMEGLAVGRGADGRTVLTLVSDDNTSILQRTLILQFAIAE